MPVRSVKTHLTPLMRRHVCVSWRCSEGQRSRHRGTEGVCGDLHIAGSRHESSINANYLEARHREPMMSCWTQSEEPEEPRRGPGVENQGEENQGEEPERRTKERNRRGEPKRNRRGEPGRKGFLCGGHVETKGQRWKRSRSVVFHIHVLGLQAVPLDAGLFEAAVCSFIIIKQLAFSKL